MTENSKPRWFEIAENDGPATPPKASKSLPILRLRGSRQMARMPTIMKVKIAK